MRIVIIPTDLGDKDDIPKIVEAITGIPLRILPEIKIESAPMQPTSGVEFDLTEAMLEVLRQNRGQWLNALQIEQKILETFDTARTAGYKPAGIRKGIAASGMYLERNGSVEVDKSEGPGSYRYRVP